MGDDIGHKSLQPARRPEPGQGHGWRHARRILRGLVIGAASFIGIIGVLLGGTIWRLSQGPIILDPVTPFLASALSSGPTGVVVTIDHTVLSWSNGRLRLVADGVHLNQHITGAHLTFRAMQIAISPWALLRGRLAPSRVILDRPNLYLVRATDGSFRLALGEENGESQAGEFWGARLARDVAESPGGSGPLGYLTDFAIHDATLTVDDRSLGVTWHAKRFNLSMHRTRTGLDGTLQVAVSIAGKTTLLSSRVSYHAPHRLLFTVDFDSLSPATFASAVPALNPLAAINMPVSGKMMIGIDPATLMISAAVCDLHFGVGTLRNDELPDGFVAVTSGILRASYDPTRGRINIETLEFDIGGPKVAIKGQVNDLGKNLLGGHWPQKFDASAHLTANSIPINTLPHLWPKHVGPRTRHWITTRVHDGMINDVSAALALHVDTEAPKPVTVTEFRGSGTYHNLTIDYFPPLEPVRGVDGTVTFDRKHMDFTPTSGHVLNGYATAANIKLYNLDTNNEMGDIDVDLSGPLRDALEVLDTNPLGYAKALGLDAKHARGSFTAHMFFRLPLKHDLNFDEVEYHAEAQLSDIAIPHAFFNRDLSNGDFKMKLDRSALMLDGTAMVEGAPVRLTWTQKFRGGGPKRHYTVRGRIDNTVRARLGLEFGGWAMMKGPVDVDLTYDETANRHAEASVTADLKNAAVDIPKLGWRKPANNAAVAKFTLGFDDDRLVSIHDATLKGGGINLRLSAAFDKSGLVRVDVPELIAGSTDVAAVLKRNGPGWNLTVSGASYDAEGLLNDVSRPSAGNEPPITIDATLGRLVLGAGRQVDHLIARLRSNGPHWQEAVIDGVLKDGKKLTVRFGGLKGPGRFDLKAEDFGALLRVLDITNDVQGGTFSVIGNAVNESGKRVLKGVFTGADYRVVHAPLFARLLTLTSFTGLSDLLTGGSGIPFRALEGDIVYGAGTIKITNMRAYGGALGISVNGTVNHNAGTLDASGTLVPANILNTIIGDIPVIGSLLMGGPGQGIIGANFRIAGPIEDPKIAVNPLSALAPGFLRNLFLFKAWNPAPNAPPAVPPTAAPATPQVAPTSSVVPNP